MNRAIDKNGKEIKPGDLIVYSNWLATVFDITDSGELHIGLKELDNIILQIMIKDDREKIEVVTEQEAIMFVLKRGQNDFR